MTTVGRMQVVVTANTRPLEKNLDRSGRKLNHWDKTAKTTASGGATALQRKLDLADSSSAKLDRELAGLGKRTDKLNRRMKGASKSTATFGKSMSTVGRRAKMFGIGMAIAATAGVVLLTKRSFESVDKLQKVAQKLGLTTEELGKMRYAAERTGVASNTLDMAIQRVTRRIAEAAGGTGEAQAAIKELGLDAKRLKQMGPWAALLQIADALNRVKDQGDRVRLSFKLFDSEGVALVSTMALGSEGLQALGDKAERLGVLVSEVDATAIVAANDAIADFKTMITGIGNLIAAELAVPFERAAKAMTEHAERNKIFVRNAIEDQKKIAKDASGHGFSIGGAIGGAAIGTITTKSPLGALAGAGIGAAGGFGIDKYMAGQLGGPGGGSDLEKEFARATEQLVMGKVKGVSDAQMKRMVATVVNLGKMIDAQNKFIESEGELGSRTGMTDAQLKERFAKAFPEKYGITKEPPTAEPPTMPTVEEPQSPAEPKMKVDELETWAKHMSERLRTPTEVYNDMTEKLSEALDKGHLSWDDYGRGIQQAREELERSIETTKAMKDAIEEMDKAKDRDAAREFGLVPPQEPTGRDVLNARQQERFRNLDTENLAGRASRGLEGSMAEQFATGQTSRPFMTQTLSGTPQTPSFGERMGAKLGPTIKSLSDTLMDRAVNVRANQIGRDPIAAGAGGDITPEISADVVDLLTDIKQILSRGIPSVVG